MLRVYHFVLRQKISVKYNDLHKVKKRLIITHTGQGGCGRVIGSDCQSLIKKLLDLYIWKL